MSIDDSVVRVWNCYKNPGKLIKDENLTLEECKIVDGQHMLMEVRLDDGNWPRDKKRGPSMKTKFKEGKKKRKKNPRRLTFIKGTVVASFLRLTVPYYYFSKGSKIGGMALASTFHHFKAAFGFQAFDDSSAYK